MPNPKQPSTLQPRNWSIEQLPGLSQPDAAKLQAGGITTTQQLLQTASTPATKQAIATQLQVHLHHVIDTLATKLAL